MSSNTRGAFAEVLPGVFSRPGGPSATSRAGSQLETAEPTAAEPTAAAASLVSLNAEAAASGTDPADVTRDEPPGGDVTSDASETDTTRQPEQAVRGEAHNALLDAVRAGLVDDSRAWARRVRLLCELDRLAGLSELAGVPQFPELEAAGSWQVSQLTAARWAADAHRMESCLPSTLAALEAGTLLVHQAQVLLHRTRNCPDSVAQAVEAELLLTAAGLTPADLRKRVDRAVLRIESEQASPQAAEQRHAEAASDRHVFTRPEVDGMAVAGAVLTAEQVVAWKTGLDQLELRERLMDRGAGVTRTAEQRRADLFAALPAMVLAGTALDRGVSRAVDPGAFVPCPCGRTAESCCHLAAPTATLGTSDATSPILPLAPWTFDAADVAAQIVLNVLVPVATVLELSREPGELAGYGPVSAEHVRLVRPHALRRVLVDSVTGTPIQVDDRVTPAATDAVGRRRQVREMLSPAVIVNADEPHHDPSARLARLVDLRDKHCCGPGCSSTRTDRDHLRPWPQGPTSERNVGRLSRRCHRAKHHGWTLLRHDDTSTSWLSPLGRTYDRPAPHPPPPRVDIWQDPPPPRPAPVVAVRWATGKDTTVPMPDPQAPANRAEAPAPDDPPF